MDDSDYVAAQTKKITQARENFPLQPIVFAGSGLSRRWLNAPTWHALLDWAIQKCPEITKPIQFYVQQEEGLPQVADRIAKQYQSWAWGAGSNNFPRILFEASVPSDIYLKYSIAQYIKTFGSDVLDDYKVERDAFCRIRPHAVITTNYDTLLESTLAGYQPILGAGLISAPFANIGEIYKIHGTVEKPSSMILTGSDYAAFATKRKYLTAKLLTFFAEHPIVFVGYSVEDSNIRKILGDLNEAVGINGGLSKNIFFLTRANGDEPGYEKVLQVSHESSIRVNLIEAADFGWVFDAFGHNAPLSNVNPQLLRSLLARTFQLVRSDIPKQKMEVDFELISGAIGSKDKLAKVFGIGTLQPVTVFSAKYPYNLTELGKKLGFPSWHGAHQLIQKIAGETGTNIKESDNRYHGTVRISKKSKAQMYSDDAVDLLERVNTGQQYELDMENE